jgi:hypothetical protein
MKQPLWLAAVLVCSACSGKEDPTPGTTDSGTTVVTSDTGDSGDGCTTAEGELAVAVLVDGVAPSNVDNFRALVREGEDIPIEVTLSDDAIGELTLDEGAYGVSALALDGNAEAQWTESVIVLACARTEVTVEMAGFGR